MKTTVLGTWLLILVAGATLGPSDARAQTPTGSLYEVSESASLRLKKKGNTRSATATLFGSLSAGSPICPMALGASPCKVVVIASDAIDVATGIGPVTGTFQVIRGQLDNDVDTPEEIVIEGSLGHGEIDLSPVLAAIPVPLGSISAKWEAKGIKGTVAEKFKAKGDLIGIFRLPFVDPQVGADEPSYIIGNSVVPVQLDEYSLGWPTVRLDIISMTQSGGKADD